MSSSSSHHQPHRINKLSHSNSVASISSNASNVSIHASVSPTPTNIATSHNDGTADNDLQSISLSSIDNHNHNHNSSSSLMMAHHHGDCDNDDDDDQDDHEDEDVRVKLIPAAQTSAVIYTATTATTTTTATNGNNRQEVVVELPPSSPLPLPPPSNGLALNGTETGHCANNNNNHNNNNNFIVSLNHKLFKRWGNGSAVSGKVDKNIELLWRNLSYDVAHFRWSKWLRTGAGGVVPCSISNGYEHQRLLDSISGSVRSGELVAIMGPSGAGKTTLIECISGRRRVGVSGDILVSGGGKRTKLAYNAQDDSLMPCLTVYETLLFASKLRNYQRNNRLKVKLVDDNDNVYNATTYPDKDLIISLTDKAYHRNLVNSIIHKLGLESCMHVKAENCSGGQQKRLSIALELIHSPTILILDEPTSGLDSVSCLQCVTLLRDLAHNPEQPMAIAASIHQPTARILQNFDRLYVIAVNGQCLYDGPTDQLVCYLSRFNLSCPTYHNPADFVVEIASTDYGTEVVKQLVEVQRTRHQQKYSQAVVVATNNNNNNNNNNNDDVNLLPLPPKYDHSTTETATPTNSNELTKDSHLVRINQENVVNVDIDDDDEDEDEEEEDDDDDDDNVRRKSKNCLELDLARQWPASVAGNGDQSSDTVSIGKICKRSRRQVKRRELYKTWILWTRCFKLSIRDPTEYLLRAFACVAIIFLNLILYYDSNIGQADGCSQDSLLHLMEKLKTDYNTNQSFSMSDTLLEGPGALAILNFGFVFFAILFVAFLSMMPVILTFPMEVGVFYKEYFNGWYSFSSYFLAKNFTNLLPTILVPVIFGASAYVITGQIWERWRFFYFIAILVLIALVADGVGIAISAMFVHNVNAASIFAAIAQIPMLLFTGLLVQINTLPAFIRPFTYLSYYRLCFESALITLYGYGRCQRPKSFDMKEIRRLLGDDVEEVMDCVSSHVSYFGNNDEPGQTSLITRFSAIMAQVDKQNPSLIMKNFNLSDDDLHFEIFLLIVYAIIARIVAYLMLYRKANAQK